MLIRKATKKDFKELCRLKRELILFQNNVNKENRADEKKLKSSDDMIKTYMGRDYSIFYLAFVKDKAVGFIHGTVDPKPQNHIQAYIQELFVEEKHRKKGVGTALVNTLHEFFNEKEVIAGLSTDEDNKDTIEFYQKKGYKVSEIKNKVAYLIQKKKVLLVYPPFCTPASPPYSLTDMAAFLKGNCEDEINAIDLNLFYHAKAFPKYQKFSKSFAKKYNPEEYAEKTGLFLEETKKNYSKNHRLILEEEKPDYFKECMDEILKCNPDIVAISIVYSSQAFYAHALIKELMKKGIKTVIGGPAVNKRLKADAILKNKMELLSYITGKEVDHNELDFDTIPDFTIYDLKKYFTPKSVLPVRTSYSCSYKKCAFCVHHEGAPYMQLPLEHFIKTVKQSKEKYFFIVDEMIPKNRLLEIARMIKPLKVMWACQLRATKDLDKKTLQILHDSGLRMALWGIECGNNRVLKLIGKGITKEGSAKVLQDAHSAGIENIAYIIFGFPTETKEEFIETIEYLKENKNAIDLVSTSAFGLQEGALIFNDPKKYGITKITKEERTLLGPKITYEVSSGLTQADAKRLRKRYRKTLESINTYPKKMNFFREHMLVLNKL